MRLKDALRYGPFDAVVAPFDHDAPVEFDRDNFPLEPIDDRFVVAKLAILERKACDVADADASRLAADVL